MHPRTRRSRRRRARAGRNTGSCWRTFGTALVASRAGRVVVVEAEAHRLAILERGGTVRRIDVGDGYPAFAAFAPDETVWFTEPNHLGHVDATGRVTLQSISVELSNGAETSGIAVAADGTVWILLGHRPKNLDIATIAQHRPQLNDATLLRVRRTPRSRCSRSRRCRPRSLRSIPAAHRCSSPSRRSCVNRCPDRTSSAAFGKERR